MAKSSKWLPKEEFFAQYRNPNWQKKRLEVMDHHHFKCENCGNTDKELHVHHKKYKKSAKVWEYEINELSCLCKLCHEKHHKLKTRLEALIAKSSVETIMHVIGYLIGRQHREVCGPWESGFVELTSHEEFAGLSDAIYLHPKRDVIINAMIGQYGIVHDDLFCLDSLDELREALDLEIGNG